MIVIPVSSNSLDALVANLGLLSVSNTFNLAHDGEDPSGGDAVVVDNMVVELSSVQLLRLNLKRFNSYYAIMDCILLEGNPLMISVRFSICLKQFGTPLSLKLIVKTALCYMEDECLGYPGASTVTSRSLDSITLLWLAIPATQP